eukprot:m.180243 g.180243  ORF g.180243 m.180243 type:complete len:326 (-) comp25410_c0_seq8:109-1086(-)
MDYLNQTVQEAKKKDQPFFLMTGFRKPHAPWQVPQRMLDLYPNYTDIAPAKYDTFPSNSPLIAWSHCLGVTLPNGTSFQYSPFEAVPKWVQSYQRRFYYADVSYVDENIGYILDTLDQLGVAEDTAIVVHSDHGYSLSEHGYWEKKSNFDLTVRVPLMIHVPWKPASHGKRTGSLTELIDVFPTLAALAGLPKPENIDGNDVSALFDHPEKIVKSIAYHQYPACNVNSYNQTRAECNQVPKNKFDYMGYTMRTEEYRYTAWFPWNKTTLTPDFSAKYAAELYNHTGDTGDQSTTMDDYENDNLVDSLPQIAEALHTQLVEFFSKH